MTKGWNHAGTAEQARRASLDGMLLPLERKGRDLAAEVRGPRRLRAGLQ